MVDAGMYAAVSFAILLVSGVAARTWLVSTEHQTAKLASEPSDSEVGTQLGGRNALIEGSDGKDGSV